MKRVVLTVEVTMDVPDETKSEDLRVSFLGELGEGIWLYDGDKWLTQAKLVDYQTIDADDSVD